MMTFNLALGLFVLVVVTNTTVVYGQCKPHCKEGEPSELVCARKVNSNTCRRLKMCELQDLNCGKSVKVWNAVDAKQCGNIRGSGTCVCKSVKKCGSKKCKREEIRRVKCYSSNNNECRLLSVCQAKTDNCKRPANDRLKSVDGKGCQGMKRGDKPRKCGGPTKKSSDESI